MATEVSFEGRKITLPGVYSTIKSGVKNPPITLSYGNVLIIDNGSGAGYGGGAGIDGELSSGLDTIYPITNIQDFRTLTKGGPWYKLAKPLFQPVPQPGINGASTVYYVRAATTTAATMSFTPTGGGANGGTFTIKCRDEGIVGNGVQDSGDELRKGYAFKLIAGIEDPAKFILIIYRGTFTGLAADGYPYGDSLEADSAPVEVIRSDEFSLISELNTWATNDGIFQEYFKISAYSASGDGSIDSTDLTNFSDYTLAATGSETFSTANFNLVLQAVSTLRYTFILSDKFGDDAQNILNDLLLSHVSDPQTLWEKMIFIGGGVDNTKWTQTNGSIPAAQHFNSDRVVVVHGGVKVSSSFSPTGIRNENSLYTAAMVLGRIAGLAPQIPGTFKTLPIEGLQHQLTDTEKKNGLKYGVLMLHYDTQLETPSFCILQAVNTLQNNINIINQDGTTNEISIRRISAQLNLELTINARTELLGNEAGANLNTLSDRFIIDWTAGQLQARTANENTDNLIISYRNISVTTNQDVKSVTYEFKPNGPINKFIMVGFMVN